MVLCASPNVHDTGTSLISVRSVVQLYPGPYFELVAPLGVCQVGFFMGRNCVGVSIRRVDCYPPRAFNGFLPSSASRIVDFIGPLVTPENRLRLLPSTEVAQILQRGVLQLRRELGSVVSCNVGQEAWFEISNTLGATPNGQEQTYQPVLVWTLDMSSPPPFFQAQVDHRRRARDRIVDREGLRSWRPRVFVQHEWHSLWLRTPVRRVIAMPSSCDPRGVPPIPRRRRRAAT
jgi:hypothetical protein